MRVYGCIGRRKLWILSRVFLFLKRPSEAEIADALQTAAAIGDDRLQEKFQGKSLPESWTHGSAEQRQRWLLRGLDTGNISSCDTFSATTLE